MTQFIQETRGFADFAADFRKFIGLLEKPKTLADFESGISDLEDKLKQKKEAEAIIKKASTLEADLAARALVVEKQEADSAEKNKKATEANEETLALKAQAEKDSESLVKKIKETDSAKAKAEAAQKKAADKEIIADKKIEENESLKKELEESIFNYNQAVANLKAAKVV